MVSLTSSPGRWVRIATIRVGLSVTARPSSAVTTSPFLSPASSAGLPSSMSWICASLAGAVAVHGGADHRVASLAVPEDLVGGDLDLLDRDGEADADVAGLAVDAAPLVVAIAEFTPTTWPRRSTSGPPELPGLIAASVCTALM